MYKLNSLKCKIFLKYSNYFINKYEFNLNFLIYEFVLQSTHTISNSNNKITQLNI